jgi:hypothetical protein
MTHDHYILDEATTPRLRKGFFNRDTSAWTIPMLCIGIATIACCVLIPAADENRQLRAETQNLQANLTQIKHQIAVNDQFLKSVTDDPTLLERLAERQMKMVRSGEAVLDLKGQAARPEMSPYLLTNLPAPAAPIAIRPGNSALDKLAEQPRVRLFTMGAALLMMAAGLVLGVSSPR